MLKKLLKYDYRANIFYFAVMYAALVILSLITRAAVTGDYANYYYSNYYGFFGGGMFAVIIYVMCCGAVIFLSYLLISMRFYRNLMGSEGYLSFTLPVTSGKHLASKFISAVTMILLSFIFILFSAFIITAGTGFWNALFGSMITEIIRTLRFYNPLISVISILNGAGWLAGSVLSIFFAVCVGQLAGKHKVSAAIGIFAACVVFLWLVRRLGNMVILYNFGYGMSDSAYLLVTGLLRLIYHIIVCGGYAAGSYMLMKYRLNLE